MTQFLFALVWWIGLVAVAVAVAVIGMVVVVSARDRFWDRDRRRHITECERRERGHGVRATSFEFCEQLWRLPTSRVADD